MMRSLKLLMKNSMRHRISNKLASSDGKSVSINVEGRAHCLSTFCSALAIENYKKRKTQTSEELELQKFELGVRRWLHK